MWVPIIRSWALTRGYALHPGTRNRYEIRYTRTQHRPPSRQVNDHGRVSGTHKSAVSQLERGDDVRVSTLRSYLEGLGARLQITAVFGDGEAESAIPIRIGADIP